MPPLRRYLRITRYSVLEVRIYLDNPLDLHRWLLSPRENVLQRVIEAVRPLVLPKLREENQRQGGGGGGGNEAGSKGGEKGKGKGKGGKRKGVKDVVVEEDFEVSVFLTNTSTRHAILKREKRAKGGDGDDWGGRLGTKGGKMTSGTRDKPMEVGEDEDRDDGDCGAVVVREESPDGEDEGIRGMEGIPSATDATNATAVAGRSTNNEEDVEAFFLSDTEDTTPSRKRRRRTVLKAEESEQMIQDRNAGDEDDKKKMGMNTTYDGFNIYGKILCLVVKRRGGVGARAKEGGLGGGGGQAMMEEWISSTQQAGQSMED